MFAEVWSIGMRAGEINVSADVICGVSVDMLADTEVIVVADTVITLEFAVTVPDAVDVLGDIWAGIILGVVPDVDVDMSDVDMNGFTTVLTALKFAYVIFIALWLLLCVFVSYFVHYGCSGACLRYVSYTQTDLVSACEKKESDCTGVCPWLLRCLPV